MDKFSKFIKDVRLTYDKEIYLNRERSRLQSECNLLIQINQLNPAIDISGDLRLRQELLNQIGSLLNQMGNDVVADEAQITAVDIERKNLECL